MRTLLTFCFCLGIVCTLSAQTIFGVVRDSSDHQPIPYCNILVKGTTKGVIAESDGSFRLTVDALPATLVFRCVGYRVEEISVTDVNKRVSADLSPVTLYMKEVVIGVNLPVCVQSNKAIMAADFEYYDNYLLLLAYRDTKSAELILSDEWGNPVSYLIVSGKMESLYRDAFGKVHIQSADSSWQVYYDYEKLQLLEPVSAFDIEYIVKPAKLYFGGRLYFQLSRYHEQRCIYMSASEGKMSRFFYACDTSGTQYIQRKYDIRYFLDKRKKGEGYQTSVRYIKTHTDQLQSELFLDQEDKIFLRPLNAPLVLHDNAVWIFQFSENIAIRFNEKQLPIDTVPLTFHHEQGWQGTVIRDEITDQLYTTYVTGGITKLVLLDPVTFRETTATTFSDFPFIKKLLIRNGIAYFLWRDVRGEGTNRLLYRYAI